MAGLLAGGSRRISLAFPGLAAQWHRTKDPHRWQSRGRLGLRASRSGPPVPIPDEAPALDAAWAPCTACV